MLVLIGIIVIALNSDLVNKMSNPMLLHVALIYLAVIKTLHKKFRYGVPLILIAQLALFFLCSCKTKQHIETAMPIQHGYTPEHSSNVFLIMYDAEIGKDPLLKAIKEYKCEIVYDYGIINGMALKKPENKTLEETMQYFKTVKGVTNVEYDHIIRLTDPVKPRLEIK